MNTTIQNICIWAFSGTNDSNSRSAINYEELILKVSQMTWDDRMISCVGAMSTKIRIYLNIQHGTKIWGCHREEIV